jgi:hypothetical protein
MLQHPAAHSILWQPTVNTMVSKVENENDNHKELKASAFFIDFQN